MTEMIRLQDAKRHMWLYAFALSLFEFIAPISFFIFLSSQATNESDAGFWGMLAIGCLFFVGFYQFIYKVPLVLFALLGHRPTLYFSLLFSALLNCLITLSVWALVL